MTEPDDPVSFFAVTNFRNERQPVGIKQSDRLSHTYIIGKTGTGKSTLMEVLLMQDLLASRGFALIDPHGDLAERIWAQTPEHLRDRITYLNAPDARQPYGYNPLRRVHPDRIPLAASGILETLRKLWPNAWGVRMEHVLRNSLYALLEQDEASLPDILRLYADKKYRKAIARRLSNPVVQQFWKTEFENYPARLRAEAVVPIQNKLGAMLADPTLFRILVKPVMDIRLRPLMDQGRGLIVNLAKGRLGEDAALVLGGLLVNSIALAAFSRANTPADERRVFLAYIDEFQSFTTLALVNMMSELRKYAVGLTLAHQHLEQLEFQLRSAVLGNAGSLICFRAGAPDAPTLERELGHVFSQADLINLPNRSAYIRMMIDGSPSKPFSVTTLPIGQ
jgi:hypothetical protein